jgi:hypothetical protein
MGYEYRTFNLPRRIDEEWVRCLNDLGRDNWEIVGSPNVHYEQIVVDARRVEYGADAPWSWEYHVFQTSPAPNGWREHLASCHWELLEPPIFNYRGVIEHLGKRPGTWSGQDDGDIVRRLKEMGWEQVYPGGWVHPESEEYQRTSLCSAILVILGYKWEESERRGEGIHTYEAVRWWLANDYVPMLAEMHGLTGVADVLPAARDLPADDVLSLLISKREALGSGAYLPTLPAVLDGLVKEQQKE